MDFVDIWKATSIVSTGAFGILGLLTEFRNKHSKKITKWGYISLAGIVISTVCGTIAQLRETQSSAEKALQVAQQSNLMLKDVQRSLSPLDEIQVALSFWVDCGDENVRRLCQSDSTLKKLTLPINVQVFLSPQVAKDYVEGRRHLGDGELMYACTSNQMQVGQIHEGVVLQGDSDFVRPLMNNGKIVSRLDLHDAVVIVESGLSAGDFASRPDVVPSYHGLKLRSFIIEPRVGERIIAKPSIKKVKIAGLDAFQVELQ